VLPFKRFDNGKNNLWQLGTMFRPASFTSLPPSVTTKPDIEAFFNKYRSLVTPEKFDDFRYLIDKARPSRGHRYFISSFGGMFRFKHDCYASMDTQHSEHADLSKMEVILVEDVDVRFLATQDATYHLDAQFFAHQAP
jgi:hypothetical protein